MHLDCGSCVVRDWHPRDKRALVRSANNRNIWRNLKDTFPHPYTDADADGWIAHVSGARVPTHWAIEVGGEAVGGIGFDPGKGIHARGAHFGYWLGQDHWGQGIATAAATAFVRHVEAQRLFARLEAPVFEWNPASMRVLEKVGFVREGVLRKSVTKDDPLIDSVLYGYVAAASPPLHTVSVDLP